MASLFVSSQSITLLLLIYPEGFTVRILFGALQNFRQALLLGFIKKSDNEGYGTYIPIAKEIWDSIKLANAETQNPS